MHFAYFICRGLNKWTLLLHGSWGSSVHYSKLLRKTEPIYWEIYYRELIHALMQVRASISAVGKLEKWETWIWRPETQENWRSRSETERKDHSPSQSCQIEILFHSVVLLYCRYSVDWMRSITLRLTICFTQSTYLNIFLI